MTFKDLGLSNSLLKAIEEKGYTKPSPIQEKAIPRVLEGKDVLASAQTGTGKTAGFVLPILHLLDNGVEYRKRPIRSLIITPTRELAAQIHQNVKEYAKHMDIKSMVMFGGVNQKPQVSQLKQGVDILIATPGRLIDLNNQGFIDLKKVKVFVLDEADRMLDMGFVRDIQRIMTLLPERRQNLLFSATFSKDIKKLANGILNNPVAVEATPENTTVEVIKQRIIRMDKPRKTAYTIKMIDEGDWQQVLIFTRTKHGANKLTEKLNNKKISAMAIHGNKSQNHRTKALAQFKKGEVRVLVATDIAARGIDIPLLPHVINYEIPNISEDYVHRIGRTGRAGANGVAISLVDNDELAYIRDIEKLTKQKFEKEIIEGYEPPHIDEKDIKKPKGNGGQNRNNRGRSKNPNSKPGNKKHYHTNNKKGGGNRGGGNSGRG
ncbi:MAG: DEAD/DEAH box helicase [Flavobacteriales bacterium]